MQGQSSLSEWESPLMHETTARREADKDRTAERLVNEVKDCSNVHLDLIEL